MSTGDQPGRPEGYEPFFGLTEAPFSLAPDPRFLFASASHSAALAQVANALERREPLVVVTGEIGTGKTLLCRIVLQRLGRKTFLSVINDPQLERDDLLKQLLEDFGVISTDRTRLTETSRHELIQALHAFLRSLLPIKAHAVVIIDEAQHLKPDVLEQIRLLSNVDDQHGTLLQIILVGQTDMEALLARPELRQLQQRVSRRLRLEPLTRQEVQQYIEHRLALARNGKPSSQLPGAAELARELAAWAGTSTGPDFTPDAIHAVTQLSGGLPRVINLLCDRSLEKACAARLRIVDAALIREAASALGIGPPASTTADHASTASTSADQVTPGAAEHAPPPATAAEQAPPTTAPKPTAATSVPAAAAPVSTLAEQAPKTTAPEQASPTSGVTAAQASPAITPATSVAATHSTQTGLDDSFWGVIGSGSQTGDAIVRPADPFVRPVPMAPTVAAPHLVKYLGLAAVLTLAGVGVWFAVRADQPAAPPQSPLPAPSASSAPRDPGARPGPAPAAATTLPPSGAPAAETPAPPRAAAPAPTANAAAATSSAARFEIVVASFRTDSRATSVAAQATALGLPIRRRVSDGWQQVVSGPFASRNDAEDAQQRLQRAGLTGTQIVPAGR